MRQVWHIGQSFCSPLYFQHYNKPPFNDVEKRMQLLQRLNAIPNIALADDVLRRCPNIPLSALGDEQSLQQFLDVFSWYIQQIQAGYI